MCRFLSVLLLPLAMLGCAPQAVDPSEEAAAGASEKPAYRGDRVGHFGFGSEATPEQIVYYASMKPEAVG